MPSDTGVHSTNAVTPTVLNRTFDAASAKHEWVTHFTYLWTVEGWRCVAAFVGLFSRQGAGWSMRATMTAQLAIEALVNGDLAAGVRPTPCCIIPIEGAVYECAVQRLLADHGVTCSMSRAGNVWDNAVMESYFFSLKTERTAAKVYRSRTGQGRCVQFHRVLLQSPAAALHAGVSQSHGVRKTGRISVRGCLPNRSSPNTLHRRSRSHQHPIRTK